MNLAIAAETRRLVEARASAVAPARRAQQGDVHGLEPRMFGVRSVAIMVDSSQTAILAVGSVRRAPLEDDARRIVFRDVMTLTLSCDHRVVYGADGARFLSRLCELLARPLVLAV